MLVPARCAVLMANTVAETVSITSVLYDSLNAPTVAVTRSRRVTRGLYLWLDRPYFVTLVEHHRSIRKTIKAANPRAKAKPKPGPIGDWWRFLQHRHSSDQAGSSFESHACPQLLHTIILRDLVPQSLSHTLETVDR